MTGQHTVTPALSTASPWSPYQVGQGLLALLGVWLAGGVILRLLGVQVTGTLAIVSLTLVLEGSLLGLAWWFGPRAHAATFSTLGFRSIGLGRLTRFGLAGLLGSLAFTSAYVFVVEQAGLSWLRPPPLPDALRPQDALLATFLVVALVGPLAEEAFFRGFVFTGLARRWGPWLGALGSAVAFAALHGQVSLMVPAVASGLLFAWVFHRSGSLWPAVLAHTAQNTLAFSAVA